METLKTVLVAGVTSLVIGLGAFFAPPSTPAVDHTYGAATGPDIPSNYFSFGGFRQWAQSPRSLNQATTTVCAIQSPVATSSLEHASINFAVSSSTATLLTIAKSATAFATTTIIGSQINIAANAQATVVASTTLSATGADAAAFIFAPSTWVVMSLTGGSGTFSPTGSCEAMWRQLAY